MMAEIKFKRESGRNYMVIPPKTAQNGSYSTKMLLENKIKGLLPFYLKVVNGSEEYCYDITSLQPLNRLLEHRNITAGELNHLLTGMLRTLELLEQYLLDEREIWLEPESIYVDTDTFDCFLCLIPGNCGEFIHAFRELAQYFLDHVNNREPEAVVLAFGVFQESQKENFGIGTIRKYLKQYRGEDAKKGSEKLGREEIPVIEQYRPESWHDTARQEESPALRESDRGVERAEKAEKAEMKTAAPTARFPQKKSELWKGILICIMILIPVGIYLSGGIPAVADYRWLIIGAEIFLMVLAIVLDGRFEGGKEKPDSAVSAQPEEWQVFLSQEEKNDQEGKQTEMEEEELQTVLLVESKIEPENRRLAPLTSGDEIRVRYFPFLIGKNKQIADYCLDHPAVSRLHLRLDQTEDGYLATDLNSTNGTAVAGRPLEANEACELKIGDEVVIAGIRYRFL